MALREKYPYTSETKLVLILEVLFCTLFKGGISKQGFFMIFIAPGLSM